MLLTWLDREVPSELLPVGGGLVAAVLDLDEDETVPEVRGFASSNPTLFWRPSGVLFRNVR